MLAVRVESEAEQAVAEPWDTALLLGESLLDEEWIVGAPSELDGDRVLVDGEVGAGVDELAEQRPRGLVLMAMANPVGEQAVQGGSHDGELEIDVDLERHRGGQRIHVEEVDGLGDGVLDQHAPGIAVDQPGRRFVHLIGEQQGGLVVPEIGDGDLADGVGIVLEGGLLVEDARVPVGAADVVERDPLPGGGGFGGDGGEQLGTRPRRRSVRKWMPSWSRRARLA